MIERLVKRTKIAVVTSAIEAVGKAYVTWQKSRDKRRADAAEKDSWGYMDTNSELLKILVPKEGCEKQAIHLKKRLVHWKRRFKNHS